MFRKVHRTYGQLLLCPLADKIAVKAD